MDGLHKAILITLHGVINRQVVTYVEQFIWFFIFFTSVTLCLSNEMNRIWTEKTAHHGDYVSARCIKGIGFADNPLLYFAITSKQLALYMANG